MTRRCEQILTDHSTTNEAARKEDYFAMKPESTNSAFGGIIEAGWFPMAATSLTPGVNRGEENEPGRLGGKR
jgi:hypothetical protein